MAQPGPNDPSTAYEAYEQPAGGAGGGGGGVPSLNVELGEDNDNPVLSFADSGQQNRVNLIVTGTSGDPSTTGFVLTAEPAYARLTTTDTGSIRISQALVTVEDFDGNTLSAVSSYADSTKGYVRVATAAAQTVAAVSVLTAADGDPVVSVFPSGDVESHVVGAGFVLRSPNGTRYRIAVGNDGTLSAAAA